jgi:hypothetical protein
MKKAFGEPDTEQEEPQSQEAGFNPRSGLKINNAKSRFNAKPDTKKDFEQKVKDAISDKVDRNKKALELGQKFLSLLHDRTLSSNKSVIQKDVEKQVCNDLFFLATAVNNDPNESEGAGSLVLDTLFFKSLLIVRDRLNEMDYIVNQLKEINLNSKKE